MYKVNSLEKHNENASIDLLKIIAAILIIGSHSLPIFQDKDLDFYYGQWFFRFCVPFFFISTGYYFEVMQENKRKKCIRKLYLLFLFSTIIYIPLIIRSALASSNFLLFIFNTIFFGYGHLWYLIAAAIGTSLYWILNKKIKKNVIVIISIICLVFSIFFDEYYKLIPIMIVKNIGNAFSVFEVMRSGVFFAFPMIVIGSVINIFQKSIKHYKWLFMFGILFAILSFLEISVLRALLNDEVTLDVGLFNWENAIILFLLALKFNVKINTNFAYRIRKLSTYIYIIHIYIIAIPSALDINGWLRFLIATIGSILIALVILILRDHINNKKGKNHEKSNAGFWN